MHDAEHGPTSVFQPHHHAIQRHPLNEGPRAVKGVEHPTIRRLPGDLAEFLTQNAVIREGVLNAVAEFFLRPAVSKGDRRRIRLTLDSGAGLKILQGDFPRLPGGIHGKVEHRP
jgi:hypothetical protein